MIRNAAVLQNLTLAGFFSLLILTVLWEGWLAPVSYGPPGFWLTVKSIPLLLPLLGLVRGHAYTYIWASLLMMLYMVEGTVLLWLHRGDGFVLHSVLPYALLETILSIAFVITASLYARAMR